MARARALCFKKERPEQKHQLGPQPWLAMILIEPDR
jgi:hypothetical protein